MDFPSKDIIKNLPKLDIGLREGSTDYIDFLEWSEINYPAMYGIDCYNRPFFVLKFRIDNEFFMQTFFQRYSDNIYDWRGCGHATENLINGFSGLNNHHKQFLMDLISNGENIIDEDIYCFPKYIGKKIYLYDEEKWAAATFIQRHWRNCRYNPNFIMCKKVLINNLKQIGVVFKDD